MSKGIRREREGWLLRKRIVLAPRPKSSFHQSPTRERCIAASAMALKAAGGEPTYRSVVANCPQASLNSTTNKPVDKKRIYSVFKKE